MKRFKFIFAFFVCLFFINYSSAQTSTHRYGGLYLFQGLRSQNFSIINSKLETYNFSPSKKFMFSSGAGGYGWFGRFKVGGEGNYFRNQNKQNNKLTELQGAGGNFYTAYLINPNSKIHFLPLIALGGETIIVSANQETKATNFLEALEKPTAVRLQTGNFYIKTALQVEYKIKKTVMGLQVGYQFSPNQKWQINDTSLSDSPSNKLSNFFLRFTFGLE